MRLEDAIEDWRTASTTACTAYRRLSLYLYPMEEASLCPPSLREAPGTTQFAGLSSVESMSVARPAMPGSMIMAPFPCVGGARGLCSGGHRERGLLH